MRRSAAVLAVVGGLPAGALGCPGDGGVAHGGQGSDAGVRLVNGTESTICRVRVGRCDLDPPTTQDVLQGRAALAPGETVTVPVPAGCWNIKAEDCGGGFVSGLAGVRVDDGGATVEFTP